MDKGIKVLLFDLGGVIVTWKGVEGLRDFSEGRMTLEDARQFWLNSEWVRRFERGLCNSTEFVEGVLAELDFPVDRKKIVAAFKQWDEGPMPGALELLEELRKNYSLACLSNNNEFHWGRLKDRYQADRYFDHCYLSHEIGMIKPDPEIYEYVKDDLGLDPEEILFFDDNPECVEAARAAGMQAAVARGIEKVKEHLARRGLWVLLSSGRESD